ncbi:MAG: hypothetical protein ACOCNX_07210, partial [Prevotella sp.]
NWIQHKSKPPNYQLILYLSSALPSASGSFRCPRPTAELHCHLCNIHAYKQLVTNRAILVSNA